MTEKTNSVVTRNKKTDSNPLWRHNNAVGRLTDKPERDIGDPDGDASLLKVRNLF